MDDIARSIGWFVIAGVIIYALGKFFQSLETEKHAKANVDIHRKRLALRQIYRSTDDPQIHQEVKNNDGGWSLLMLGLDDAQYANEMRKTDQNAFDEALQRVQANGHCMLLDGKRLRWRNESDTK